MNGASHISIERLCGPVLRSVSRSFYLSIRLLPARLRDPVALAYLLARATDTVADTAEVTAKLRTEKLRDLAEAIQGKLSPDELSNLLDSFASLQKNGAEGTLIETLPACLDWLGTLEHDDRSDVRRVLEEINRGQSLDLRRFGDADGIRSLATAAELDEYTYLVAGCVGEFWTRVCFRHLRNFADRPRDEMLALGMRYGKGLQLINILRDAGSDLRSGRCYFPEAELAAKNITAAEILRQPARVEPILEKWRAEAEHGIAAGLEYVCAIRSVRVRFATALPALIGARTLALLRQAGGNALQRTVKVSRHEVREIIATAAVSFASPRSVRKMFGRLSL